MHEPQLRRDRNGVGIQDDDGEAVVAGIRCEDVEAVVDIQGTWDKDTAPCNEEEAVDKPAPLRAIPVIPFQILRQLILAIRFRDCLTWENRLLQSLEEPQLRRPLDHKEDTDNTLDVREVAADACNVAVVSLGKSWARTCRLNSQLIQRKWAQPLQQKQLSTRRL